MNTTNKFDVLENEIPLDMTDTNSEGSDEINLVITDNKTGKEINHKYKIPQSVSYEPFNKENRLVCYSIINNEECHYRNNCTYAHRLSDQKIDFERKYIYQIIVDANLMSFFTEHNPKTIENYRNLLFATKTCDKCIIGKCTGGYNCKYGVNTPMLKVCKNDLLTGECLNTILKIDISPELKNKLTIKSDVHQKIIDVGDGCINGHHLTSRGLIPFCKLQQQKEHSMRTGYHSIRYINLEPVAKLINNYNSDSSSDEEVNDWFQKN